MQKRAEHGFLFIAFVFFILLLANKSIYDKLSGSTDYVIYLAVIGTFLVARYYYDFDFRRHLIPAILFLAYGIFAILRSDGGVGSLLGFIFVPIYMCVLEKTNLSELYRKRYIRLFSTFIVIFSVFAMYISNNYTWTADNFINPNTYSLTCSFCYMYISALMDEDVTEYKRLKKSVLFVLTVYITFMLDCRIALITVIAFYIFNVLVPKVFLNEKMIMILIVSIIIISIIFPFIYVSLYTKGIDIKIPFTDKSLYTGRELLWTKFINSMGSDLNNWLFGIGSKAPIYVDTGRSTSQHLHNNSLALITSFGIVGMLMTYSYLLYQVKRVLISYKENNEILTYLIVFMCFLIEGFTENSMVGVSLFPLMCLGIPLSKNYQA